MVKTSLINFIKGFSYDQFESQGKWDVWEENSFKSIAGHIKEGTIEAFKTEEALIDKYSSIFAKRLSEDCMFMIKDTDSLYYNAGWGILAMPEINYPDLAIKDGILTYLIRLSLMNFIEKAAVLNQIWNLCIEATVDKLSKLQPFQLSIDSMKSADIKCIVVDGSQIVNFFEVWDFRFYVKRKCQNMSVLYEDFFSLDLNIPSTMNHIPFDELPRTIDLEVELEKYYCTPDFIPDKVDHYQSRTVTFFVNVNSDNSIKLVPNRESLVPVLLEQLSFWKSHIDVILDGILVVPERLYHIMKYLAENDVKTKYGSIGRVLNSKQTLEKAEEFDYDETDSMDFLLPSNIHATSYKYDAYLNQTIYAFLK